MKERKDREWKRERKTVSGREREKIEWKIEESVEKKTARGERRDREKE